MSTDKLELVGRIVHEAKRAYRMSTRGHDGSVLPWDQADAPTKYEAIKVVSTARIADLADGVSAETRFLFDVARGCLKHFGLEQPILTAEQLEVPDAPAEVPQKTGRRRN